MISANRQHEARGSGKFIGSIKDGNDFYDAYFESGEIILINGLLDFSKHLDDIINKPDEYLFTPFLEAAASYRYKN